LDGKGAVIAVAWQLRGGTYRPKTCTLPRGLTLLGGSFLSACGPKKRNRPGLFSFICPFVLSFLFILNFPAQVLDDLNEVCN